MRCRTSASVCVWHITLVACLILMAGAASAFDTSRFSKAYVDKLCDCDAARFIIIRFTDESSLIVGKNGVCVDPSMEKGSGIDKVSDLAAVTSLLTYNGEKLELRRLFYRSVGTIARERNQLAMKMSGHVPNLNAYGILRVPGDSPLTGKNLHALLERLNNDSRVAIAYPRPHYEDASAGNPSGNKSIQQTTSGTPDFEYKQTYRDGPSSYGFNANLVESWAGASGENVKVIDIEGNWNWDHEDFPTPFARVYKELIPPDKPSTHGTAAVGIIAAQDNGYGVTGFVPSAQVGGVVCPVSWDDPNNWWSAANAIDTAASLLDAGDVCFFPMQAFINNPPGDQYGLPLEWWPENFEAIQAASLVAGIICVEPSGNSPFDLNSVPFFADFVRDDPDHDCFAIMVGGVVGKDDYPSKIIGSHYGNRVDVHGWYGPATTTGQGLLYGIAQGLSEDRYYREDFGGTSAASSIVAGVVASIQSIYKAENNGQPLSPIEMRQLIRASGHYVEGVSEVVGPRPDIAEAFRYMYDVGPPEAIDDLRAGEVKSNRIQLGWSAPADDFRGMCVTGYDLRYSESPINESNFEFATQVPGVMTPWEPNLLQVATITDLNPSTTYYFAIKSSDPGGHISPISNVISVTTHARGPEIVFDPTSVDFGMARVNKTNQAQIIVRNTGTADLAIQSCQTHHGAQTHVEFTCVSYPTDPIPVGGSGIIQLSGTPLAPARLQGALEVQSNDPDRPVVYISLKIDGADLYFSDAIITTGRNRQASGVVQVQNPSMLPLSYDLRPRLYYDVSHGQPPENYACLIALFNDMNHVIGGLSEITAASLEVVDALYVSGSNSAWTTGESQLVAAWVQNGGGLFIDCGPTRLDSHTNLNPLLEELGLGTLLAFQIDPPVPIDAPSVLSLDKLLAGVDDLELTNPIYKLNDIPPGANWLVKVSDATGTYDKGLRTTVGAGRVVVIADQLFGSWNLPEGNRQFALNAFNWLWFSWFNFPVLTRTVEAQTDYDLAVNVDASRLSLGTYTYTGAALFLDTLKYFDVTLHVIDARISNIVVQYTNPSSTKIQWATNVSWPCRFRYRVLGQTTWSNPVMTPAGLSHQVSVATQVNTHYEGWIEVMSGVNVVADSLMHFKTPKRYPSLVSTGEGPPEVTYMSQNHPNPFNPTTTIPFGLAAPGAVALRIYDVGGRLVRVLVDANLGAGRYELTWNGTDLNGNKVASGVYFYRLTAPSFVETKKLILLR